MWLDDSEAVFDARERAYKLYASPCVAATVTGTRCCSR
jgi:hypothetical protein